MKTKISEVRRLMAAGDMRGAILLAAKFPRLGREARDILGAREAYLRPDFQRQIGRDPEVLKAAGAAAMVVRFGDGT